MIMKLELIMKEISMEMIKEWEYLMNQELFAIIIKFNYSTVSCFFMFHLNFVYISVIIQYICYLWNE